MLFLRIFMCFKSTFVCPLVRFRLAPLRGSLFRNYKIIQNMNRFFSFFFKFWRNIIGTRSFNYRHILKNTVTYTMIFFLPFTVNYMFFRLGSRLHVRIKTAFHGWTLSCCFHEVWLVLSALILLYIVEYLIERTLKYAGALGQC